MKDEDDDDNSARLLVLTHGDECEVWHVDTVVEEHGTGPLRPEVNFNVCLFWSGLVWLGLVWVGLVVGLDLIMGLIWFSWCSLHVCM